MSTNNSQPSSIYIGAVCAIVAISTLGVVLRVMAVRRARAAAMNLPRNAVYSSRPQSMAVPMQGYNIPPPQPTSTYSPNRPVRQQTWNTPAPPYTAPPHAPSSPPRSPASPRFNPPHGPPPAFPVPQPASPPPAPQVSPHNPPVEIHFPKPSTTSPSPPPPQSLSLMERMREVQMLMLDIHRLESDTTGTHNRARIQELQHRVTELSNVDSQGTLAEVNPRNAREPPPYNLDGREGIVFWSIPAVTFTISLFMTV
ncbi:hypothetical protein CPB84DRAFT_1749443 [Gymnopilus junonius]|uniref:Uncharacterized protein n=1 Tax=Gymnopilus junonius TaxID=109634 RepID=A0A9P5NHK3_GYMJU|nr:hypothetical protein CPB84DRAFT_1749443 [Gymnopilus junonius]